MHTIELKDVSWSVRNHFWHAPREVLKGVSLSIDQGEVFGLVGLNNAGKTATIKIITGLLRPTRGSVRIFGMEVTELAVKKRIGFLPEVPYFYDHLTGYEFLRFHERLSGKRNDRTFVYDLLERMALKDAADVPLRLYSRGMLQRIGFAQALVGDPDLLILDEPLNGLALIDQRGMKRSILDAKQRGKTTFFTSRILQDVIEVADRIAVIRNGTITDAGHIGDIIGKDVIPEQTSLEQWIRTSTEHP